MGFCIFNNIAIAAEYAIKECGIKKVAILDFDVHHGNGTQNHFYDRGEALFVSTHRMPFYPGSGHTAESGKDAGKGLNVNIALSAGQGDGAFRGAWQKLLPQVEAFKPELILVSAGFDAHEDDPLGGMNVTTDSVRWLAAELVKLSKKVCQRRLVFVLEGGYSLGALKSCVRAILEEMF
jgi:acetoin utilization deacetylase AcuC-like enzyme